MRFFTNFKIVVFISLFTSIFLTKIFANGQKFYEEGSKSYDSGDYERGLLYLRKAAEEENVPAIEKLAEIYLNNYMNSGFYAENELQDGIKLLEKASNLGSAYAMETLGFIYTSLFGDYESSIFWYEKACERGYPSAYKSLGDLYYYSYNEDFPHDYKKAFELYSKGAELGDASCLYMLASFYGIKSPDSEIWQDLKVVARDDDKAYSLFKEAIDKKNFFATHDDSNALLCLGMYWEFALGSNSIDAKKACEYYTKAVEAWDQNSLALFHLANCYDRGFGISQDYKTAMNLYKKSLKYKKKPHPSSAEGKSKYRLAQLYYTGIAGIKDIGEAKKLLEEQIKSFPDSALQEKDFFNKYFLGRHVGAELKEWHKKLYDFGIPSISMFVDTPKGLACREKPSIDSKVLTVIPDKSAIRIIDVGETVTIKDVTAPWVKVRIPIYEAVKINSYVGWVFADNLLEELPVNKGDISFLNKDGMDFYEVEKYALSGNSKAQYKLAEYYKLGLGVKKDFSAAEKWYKLAAEQDEPMASLQLACMKKDYKEWLLKAKQQGAYWGNDFWDSLAEDILATYIPATAYIPANIDEKECFTYGMMLLCKRKANEEVYYSDIIPYFMEACRKGNKDAMLYLGNIYEEMESYAEAEKWYNKAALSGRSKSDELYNKWLTWEKLIISDEKNFPKFLDEYFEIR